MGDFDFGDLAFDSVLISLLQSLGISSTFIISLITLAFAAQSWFGPGKAIFATTIKVGRHILAVGPPARPFVVIVISLFVLLAQFLTLALCYLAGNYIALTQDSERQQQFISLAENHTGSYLSRDFLKAATEWQPYASWYVAAASLLIVLSYVSAFFQAESKLDTFILGLLLGSPALILLVPIGIGAAVGGVVLLITLAVVFLFGSTSSVSDIMPDGDLIKFVAGVLLVSGLFLAACIGATMASRMVGWAWRGRPAAPTSAAGSGPPPPRLP